MSRQVKIAPSLLSADFGDLATAVRQMEAADSDWLHFDIMDGSFVPNITFGPKMVKDLRPHSALPFDVHLMIDNPGSFVTQFSEAGADFLTIHYESTTHVHRVLTQIKDLGVKVGLSIVPSTPAETVSEILHLLDLILIMTVNPGFGGQELIERTLTKVEGLRQIREEKGYTYLIEVDGGINRSTAARAVQAGADVLVAGSAVFEAENPIQEVAELRLAAQVRG